jgi:hypothetical protein
MKTVSILLIITILLSCNNNDKEINILLNENRQLKEQVAELKQNSQEKTCKFITFPTMEKYHFKQGEKGNYTISLALFDDIEKAKVILKDPNTNKFQDTFIMENGYCLQLPFKTSEIGEHIIFGEVQRPSDGIKGSEYFQIKYIVE